MYTALYRTERPEVFSEIIGQDHIVRILKNQIATDTVSHAYLFCGTRGTGKTTTARILAKAVNCLEDGERPCGRCENCMAIKNGTFMDVIEIDAASNNGVDNIRELRESVKYPPAVGRKKVYIIDEVHMLSTGASNALLKTLEEPPENVMFILATTDPEKLPQTILSRCMRLDFKRVPERVLTDHMRQICKERHVEITDSALRLLAANADGSVRDGLSLLDQCLAAGDSVLDRDVILEILGTVSEDFFIDITEKIAMHNVPEALLMIDGAVEEGKDVKQLMKDWMSHYRNLLVTKYIKNAEDMLNMSSENIARLREQGGRISLGEINDCILTLARTINDARYSTQPRILLELAAVTMASGLPADGASQGKVLPHAEYVPKTMASKVTAPKASYTAASQKSTASAVSDAGKGAETKKAPAASKKKKADEEPPWDTAGDVPQEEVSRDTSEEDRAAAAGNAPCIEIEAGAGCNLNELWNKVIEEGEKVQGSINLLRDKAEITDMKQGEVTVTTDSPFYKDYIDNNSQLITCSIEKITGKTLKMKCCCAGPDEGPAADACEEAEELAKEMSSKLNIDIKLE